MAAGLALAAMAVAPRAWAQEGIAEKLFIEGKALMQEKKYEQACEKLKASHDLDKTATGTLLNLALCHELTNKPATAWAEFRQVIAESEGRREDRVTLAREHEKKLEPSLSRIRIFVPPDARHAGLSLELDKEVPIPEASWGTELPVDPGKHSLAASAPGKTSATIDFVVGNVADRQTVVVEPLSDAALDTAHDEPTPAELARRRADSTRRGLGFAIGGAGLVAVGVGLAFGVVASNKNSDATGMCPDDRCPNLDVKNTASRTLASADNAAIIANITAGAGSLLLVGGILLVLTALPSGTTPPRAKATALRAAPVPLMHGGGFVVGGAF